MRNLNRILLVFSLLIMCITTLVFASDEVIEDVDKGIIDWTNGIIITTGFSVSSEDVTNDDQARLTVEKAALSEAYLNLLEVIEGVRVDAETSVKNFMLKSDIIKTKVEDFVKDATIITNPKTGEDYIYSSDGTVSVTIRLSLYGKGSLTDLIFPNTMRKEVLPHHEEEETTTKNDVYTGLIVDARDIEIKSALAPRILDEDGKEIYGIGFVSRQYAVEQGAVGYTKNLKAAEENKRVTDNPIVVKGVKIAGTNDTDIVINNSDVQKIIGASFLDKCSVFIVVR